MTSTVEPAGVSRLRELADILHNGWERDGDTEDEMRDAILSLIAARARIAELERLLMGLSREERDALEAGARFCCEHAVHLTSDDGVDRHPDIATYWNYAAILRRLGG